MIIDCHGHYTSAPNGHTSWRNAQLEAGAKRAQIPTYPSISDDEIHDGLSALQVKQQKERGIDLVLFSPQASSMGHHHCDDGANSEWARHCNNLIFRACRLFPDRFIGVCQLPQTMGGSWSSCLEELDRCVLELGFVGCNLNPDPSGGFWTGLPISDPFWFPLFERLCDLGVPAMIHVSGACNHNFHTTGSHYLNADTTVFMQLLQSSLFKTFPDLKIVIPHGGGAAPYHWGRFRGLAQTFGTESLEEKLLKNVFFDTCVYHQPGAALLAQVVPVGNILFASELAGAVRGIDPENGHPYDDTKRYIEAVPWLSESDRYAIYEGNALRIYPRLKTQIQRQRRML